MLKDRCLGVFDLESPELDAFNKSHVEILTLLASQAAVAIENARLYQTILRDRNPSGEGDPLCAARAGGAFAHRVAQAHEGRRCRGAVCPCLRARGDLYDFLAPEPNTLIVAVGDVSGKGVPAALYSAFAGELVRSRTFRRRFTAERSSPAGVLASMNTILHERQLGDYYCTLCYALFDLKRRTVTIANSGLPYPIRSVSKDGAEGPPPAPAQIELAGIPLGSFPGSSYDEAAFALSSGDLFVFFTDGVSEAQDGLGREFGTARLLRVIEESREKSARELVDAIFAAVQDFRGETTPNDDMTAVAIRITG